MALVICCVFLTERMRRRMSIRLGMHRFRWLLGLPPRHEISFEFLDDRDDLAAQRVIQHLLGPDLVPYVAERRVDKAVQLLFKLAALLNRQIVQVTLGSGEDD